MLVVEESEAYCVEAWRLRDFRTRRVFAEDYESLDDIIDAVDTEFQNMRDVEGVVLLWFPYPVTRFDTKSIKAYAERSGVELEWYVCPQAGDPAPVTLLSRVNNFWRTLWQK